MVKIHTASSRYSNWFVAARNYAQRRIEFSFRCWERILQSNGFGNGFWQTKGISTTKATAAPEKERCSASGCPTVYNKRKTELVTSISKMFLNLFVELIWILRKNVSSVRIADMNMLRGRKSKNRWKRRVTAMSTFQSLQASLNLVWIFTISLQLVPYYSAFICKTKCLL
jgi:hypothetical protein